MTHACSVRTARRGKVFITGASGVVGRALLRQLPHEDIICLSHHRAIGDPRIETVTGDVRKPRLGLTPDAFKRLANRTGWIIHSAANTSFTASAEQINGINVNGTRNMLAFAECANVPMTYVSTAFVHPIGSHPPGAGFNAYEESKRTAENIVRGSQASVSIVRPSIVIGESGTGITSDFQGFYHVLRLILENRLPYLPASPAGRVDFIPQDMVAEAIISLMISDVRHGEFWLTAGPHAPVLEALVMTAARTIAAYTGRAVPVPRYLRPDDSREPLTRTQRRSLEPAARSALMQLEAYDKYLSIRDPLPTSLAEIPILSRPLDANTLKTAFIRSILYWTESSLKDASFPSGERNPSNRTPTSSPVGDRLHVSL